MPEYSIRNAKKKDLPQITMLFRETIIAVNSNDYDALQVAKWSSGYKNSVKWESRIKNRYFLVAVNSDKLLGFAAATKKAKLDLLYVHKDFQSQGIGSSLLEKLEKKVLEEGIKRMEARVSTTALRFFKNKGYSIIAPENRDLGGVELLRYRMYKILK